jgi:hypothetical protein
MFIGRSDYGMRASNIEGAPKDQLSSRTKQQSDPYCSGRAFQSLPAPRSRRGGPVSDCSRSQAKQMRQVHRFAERYLVSNVAVYT